MQENSKKIKKLGWIYFVQQIAQALGTTIPVIYITFFMTDYAALTPVMVAAILMVARIIDFIVCLTAGSIIQKCNFKMGKYRPWLLWFPIVVQVGVVMQFLNPNIPLMAKAILIGVGYVLTNAPMSFIMTSTYGLQSKVCGADMNARLSISARLIQGLNVGMLVVGGISMPIITWMVSKGVNGYLWISIIYGVLNILGDILLVMATKEFDLFDPNFKYDPGANMKISQIYGETLKNPMVWVVLIRDILSMVSYYFTSSIMLYYFQYSIGNLNMQAVSATISNILGIIAAFIMPPLAKKLGKKTSVVFCTAVGAVAYILVGLFAHQHVWTYIVIISINLLIAAISTSIGINLYLDAAEYQLYKTGKDTRAFVMSLNNLPMKLGMIIATPITSWALVKAGLTQTVVDGTLVTTMENPKLLTQLFGFIPAVLYIAIVLLMAFGYRITDAQAKEYAEANQKREQEKKAAAAAASAE